MLKMSEAQITRFWKFVGIDCVSDCWIWTGGRCGYRRWYGLFMFDAKRRHALPHRAAYETWIGPIPDGLELDHQCDFKLCVNPWHLKPATTRENTLRGNSLSARRSRQSECAYGHPLVGDNLRIARSRGRGPKRVCRTCDTWRKRAKYAERAGYPHPPRPICVDVEKKSPSHLRLR